MPRSTMVVYESIMASRAHPADPNHHQLNSLLKKLKLFLEEQQQLIQLIHEEQQQLLQHLKSFCKALRFSENFLGNGAQYGGQRAPSRRQRKVLEKFQGNDAQDRSEKARSRLQRKLLQRKKLQRKAIDAAYEAEDKIEFLAGNHFLSKSQDHQSGDLSVEYHDFDKITEEINSKQKEVMEMTKNLVDWKDFQELPRSNPPITISSSRQPNPQFSDNSMVGFEEEFLKMKELILNRSQQEQERLLKIIPIVGMGGAGKTTFATSVYNDQEIQNHFDVLALAKLTQNYKVGKIVIDLLRQIKNQIPETQKPRDGELPENLYQILKRKRYLIVMDDVWSKEAWDDFSMCFPDDCTGCRILLTTRLTSVADYVKSGRADHHQMRPLKSDESWKLFQEQVFRNESCPLELEEIGKDIVEKCQGLPLAVVVISGLLSKIDRRREIWEDTVEKISSIAVTDERFSDILMLSYNNLPPAIKVCFLYMGILFLQNKEIRVSKLIKLWEAEGFLKPDKSKTLKIVAENYLRDLVERNLISVIRKGSNGEMRRCGIHDLLIDLCVKIGQMENVFYVHDKRHSCDGLPSGKNITRLVITRKYQNDDNDPFNLTRLSKECSSRVQSLIFAIHSYRKYPSSGYYSCFKLMRVFNASKLNFKCFPGEILELVNLRYLALCTESRQIPSSICKLCALKTLIVKPPRFRPASYCLPPEIWGMPQLKHIHFPCGFLPVPKQDIKKDLVPRTSLETLPLLENFELSEEVVRRLANLQKVKLHYNDYKDANGSYELGISNLHNLVQLGSLEVLSCTIDPTYMGKMTGLKHCVVERLAFPRTLKKLTLYECQIPWEYMTIIGSLPILQVLKLEVDAFKGKKWETMEGQFCELKFLLLSRLDLEEWRAESSHFPNLECLIVASCLDLKRIPGGIGGIQTLKVINLDNCNSSAAISAEEILIDNQEMGFDGLQINISHVRGQTSNSV